MRGFFFGRGGVGALTFLGLSAADTAAHSMNSLGPFVVNALLGAGVLGIAQAGVWSALELLFYAGAMFGIAPFARRLDLRRLAFVAAACVVVAQGASAFAGQVWLLMVLRCLSGTGLGLFNACVNIGAARTGHPTRVLSLVMVAQTIVFTLASVVLPVAAARAGPAGVLGALAILVAVLTPFLVFLPQKGEAPDLPAVVRARGEAGSCPTWLAVTAVLAVVLYTGGSLCVWSFTAHIAGRIGLAAGDFGRLSAFANVLGLGCGLLSAGLGERRAGAPVLVGAIVVTGIACAVQSAPPHVWAFVVAYLANYGLWFLVYPGLISLTCRIDASGRLATIASGSWILSQASATAAAGFFARQGAFATVGQAGFVACLLGAVATGAVTSGMRRHRVSPGPRARA